MNVSDLFDKGSVSRIVLVHDKVVDRRPNEPEYVHWYEVHIEPGNQSVVQTMTMFVTYGKLDEFLTSFGWSFEIDRIEHLYQN